MVARSQRQFARADQAAILAGQSDGFAARGIDEFDDLLVDLARQHHLDDVHRLGVGDPHALHELAFLPDPSQQLLNLWTPAVHHHRIQTDQFEQDHIMGKAALQALLGHRIATVLDDDRAAMKPADVGQCLSKDLGLDMRWGGDAHRGPRVIGRNGRDPGWPPDLRAAHRQTRHQ